MRCKSFIIFLICLGIGINLFGKSVKTVRISPMKLQWNADQKRFNVFFSIENWSEEDIETTYILVLKVGKQKVWRGNRLPIIRANSKRPFMMSVSPEIITKNDYFSVSVNLYGKDYNGLIDRSANYINIKTQRLVEKGNLKLNLIEMPGPEILNKIRKQEQQALKTGKEIKYVPEKKKIEFNIGPVKELSKVIADNRESQTSELKTFTTSENLAGFSDTEEIADLFVEEVNPVKKDKMISKDKALPKLLELKKNWVEASAPQENIQFEQLKPRKSGTTDQAEHIKSDEPEITTPEITAPEKVDLKSLEYGLSASVISPLPVISGEKELGPKENEMEFPEKKEPAPVTAKADNLDISLNEDSSIRLTLSGHSDIGGRLSYTIVNKCSKGLLSGTAPDLIYTPKKDYSGSDYFTYKVNDGGPDSNTATVRIAVNSVNDAPSAKTEDYTIGEGTERNITLTGFDIEENPLKYSIVTHPLHGLLQGEAPDLVYIASLDYLGNDSFTFKVNDGSINSKMARVNLSIVPLTQKSPEVNAQNYDIQIVSPSHLQESVTDKKTGILKIKVFSFLPVKNIEINGRETVPDQGSQVEIDVPYDLTEEINTYTITVNTRKQTEQKTFIIHYKPIKKVLRMIGILGIFTTDNLDYSPASIDPVSASKLVFTFVPQFDVELVKGSLLRLRGILYGEKILNEEYESRELSFSQLNTEWIAKKTTLGRLNGGIGYNIVRADNSDSLFGSQGTANETTLFAGLEKEIDKTSNFKLDFEIKSSDSQLETDSPDDNADALILSLKAGYKFNLFDIRSTAKAKLGNSDAVGKYQDSSNWLLGFKQEYSIGKFSGSWEYSLKETEKKETDSRVNDNGIRAKNVTGIFNLRLNYQLFPQTILSLNLKNRQQSSNVESFNYEVNTVALSMIHVF